MKAKSKEIKDILEIEPFINLKILQQKVIEFNFPSDHNEYDINEAVIDLEYIRDNLLITIDNNILDTYSFKSRNVIKDYLTALTANINGIINGQNTVPSLLDEIQRIKEYVLITLNLDLKSENLFDSKKKIMELNELQKKYNSLLVELEKANNIYDKIKEKYDSINENYSNSQDLITQHNELKNQFEEQNKTISGLVTNIQNNSNQVDSQSNIINGFFNKVTEYETKLELAEQELQRLLEVNKDLENKVLELLSSAVGGVLGKTFGERKSELNKSEIFWKRSTFASILLLFVAATFIYIDLLKGVSESPVILSKITLLIPISAAVWFTASNYNRERKLLEEYAFKSSISLSLNSYRKVLNEELPDEEKNKISSFLINSMEKIYSSPLENISKHSHGDDEIEVSLLEKVVKMIK